MTWVRDDFWPNVTMQDAPPSSTPLSHDAAANRSLDAAARRVRDALDAACVSLSAGAVGRGARALLHDGACPSDTAVAEWCRRLASSAPSVLVDAFVGIVVSPLRGAPLALRRLLGGAAGDHNATQAAAEAAAGAVDDEPTPDESACFVAACVTLVLVLATLVVRWRFRAYVQLVRGTARTD